MGGAPPVAKCKSPIELTATPGSCDTLQTEMQLVTLIDDGSSSPGGPFKLALKPRPDLDPITAAPGDTYRLKAGSTYTFTLVASNSIGANTPAPALFMHRRRMSESY